jgi:photosystem II stability/assembly factor-like uncharacterized protein
VRPYPSATVRARLAVLAALVATAAGCGGDDPAPAPAATTTPNPTAAAETPAPPTSGANAFIGSIAVDPKDGTVILGTGLGLFRLKHGASNAKRVVGELQGPDGSGPVSSNLVVRYAGPGDLLASGHPEGGALPENLGLIRSRDAGATWEPVTELGLSDFHILQVSGTRVVAVRADEKDIQVSGDIGAGGFETRTPPDTPLDVAFDPRDGKRMVVATAQGVFSSGDEGRSWRSRDGIASEQLGWAKPDALYRADPGGLVKISADGGATWKDAGSVGMSVNELAVDADGTLYASVAGGEVKRSTDGGASWSRLVKLK